MDLYAENILEHYRHPRNKIPIADLRGATHVEKNPSCGDEITLALTLDGEKIASLEWDGTGCAISQAAMSILSEELLGKEVSEIESLKKETIYELLGVPVGPRRFKCALLCLHTVKNATLKLQGRKLQEWTQTVSD